ncbi:hypothetical protein Pcinc_014647 [Petrolisthes cinctipes]|uniref:SCAN box domain-containing protein n=1 Tax=Petrolisthes cinctipes TaxID=88211 RepID=A0AAE1FUM7_PETCI|nr:hypothetical protein Pcinc_014647 [Petrolisthes cinctipes]
MPTEQQASVPLALDIHLQLQYAQIIEQSRINAEAETTKLETARVQAQLEQTKLDHEVQMRQSRQNDFEITKYVKLVPEFNEHDVTKFFAMFENVASSLSWPKSKWSIMLQTVLKGKAQNAYASLSADQSFDYDTVKRVIMNAYELVPEVYRLKFRTERKPSNQTYVEFARDKRELMNRWLHSSKVKTLDDLKQLILLEYRKSIPREISVYLLEREVKGIERAAILVDEYSLNHRIPSQKFTTYCKGNGVSNESYHVRVSPQDVAVSQSPFEPVKTFGESLISCGENREEVTMLLDSGALQSLLLKGVVPVEKSGKTVLVNSLWGLDAVPLVTIHLESELFSGSALVGVVDQLPVPGVQLILGNDLAGGKMGSLPVVSEVPVESKETEKLVEEVLDVFPVCAVTRSMTARKESEPDETEMELPLCEDLEVDLSETFLANLDSGHESREEEEFSLSRKNLIEQKLFDIVDDECSEFYVTNDVPDECMEQDPAIEITEPWNSSEETTIALEQKLEEKLSHLNVSQKEDFTALLLRYPEVFRNTPGYTNMTTHDVDLH